MKGKLGCRPRREHNHAWPGDFTGSRRGSALCRFAERSWGKLGNGSKTGLVCHGKPAVRFHGLAAPSKRGSMQSCETATCNAALRDGTWRPASTQQVGRRHRRSRVSRWRLLHGAAGAILSTMVRATLRGDKRSRLNRSSAAKWWGAPVPRSVGRGLGGAWRQSAVARPCLPAHWKARWRLLVVEIERRWQNPTGQRR